MWRRLETDSSGFTDSPDISAGRGEVLLNSQFSSCHTGSLPTQPNYLTVVCTWHLCSSPSSPLLVPADQHLLLPSNQIVLFRSQVTSYNCQSCSIWHCSDHFLLELLWLPRRHICLDFPYSCVSWALPFYPSLLSLSSLVPFLFSVCIATSDDLMHLMALSTIYYGEL